MPTMTRPKIDAEFRDLLPALNAEVYAKLRASIQAHGCRDALVTWKEKGILLDGHNRLRACEETNSEYRVVEMSFGSRGEAYEWVIANQLGRRNLTPIEVTYLIGKRYEAEKGEEGSNQHTRRDQNEHASGRTNERVAKDSGVSPATVVRASRIASAIDTITARIGNVAKTDILRGTVKLTESELEDLASRDDVSTIDQMRAYAEECRVARLPRASTDPEQPFFQRTVNDRRLAMDPDTGEEYVEAWVLSCGHVVPTKRKVSPESKTKTMACPECGSGTRTPFDRRVTEERFEKALRVALSNRDAIDHWTKLVRAATLLATLSNLDKRRDKAREDALEALQVLGLIGGE